MHITEVFLLCSVEWDVTVQGFSWLDDLPFPIQGNCYCALKAGAAQKLHLYYQKYSQVRRIALILLQLSLQNVLTIARACQGLHIKQSLK